MQIDFLAAQGFSKDTIENWKAGGKGALLPLQVEAITRTRLLAGQFAPACQALLGYRFMTSPKREGPGWEAFQWDAAGRPKRWRYDCSTPGNRICRGVWTRQQARHAACMEAQP